MRIRARVRARASARVRVRVRVRARARGAPRWPSASMSGKRSQPPTKATPIVPTRQRAAPLA